MLIEGMSNGPDMARASWKNFSGAMIRHAVDDAMQELPVQDKQMVKLAYFGGLSNREIAQEIGVTEASVQRRLRRAVDAISEYIERGRSFGRRAFYGLLLWLSGRWVGDATHHVVQAAAVVGVAAVIVAQPVAPARPNAVTGSTLPKHAIAAPAAARPQAVAPPVPTSTIPAGQQLPTSSLPKIQVPPLSVPVTGPPPPAQVPQVPVPVTVPTLPTVPPLPTDPPLPEPVTVPPLPVVPPVTVSPLPVQPPLH
jgi:hypothetical protein